MVRPFGHDDLATCYHVDGSNTTCFFHVILLFKIGRNKMHILNPYLFSLFNVFIVFNLKVLKIHLALFINFNFESPTAIRTVYTWT